MNKAMAGAGALVLAGVGSVALAGPGGAQSADEIPSYPGTAIEVDQSGGIDDVIQLGRPGFDSVGLNSGTAGDGCTLETGEELAAVAIEIWQFDADGEPQMLDSGYTASDIEFWGGDVTEFIPADELARWTPDSTIFGSFGSTGKISLAFVPPASSGEQIFIGTCIVVDAESEMEGSVDDLERSDEAFVASYNVNAGSDNGNGDNPDNVDDDDNADNGAEDPNTTPPMTPVGGTPDLTG